MAPFQLTLIFDQKLVKSEQISPYVSDNSDFLGKSEKTWKSEKLEFQIISLKLIATYYRFMVINN